MSKVTTRVALLLLVACMAGAALTARKLEQLRQGATLEETMLLSSPKAVRYLSLGHTGLAANIYWTRAVQYFGSKLQEKRSTRYDLLRPLLNVTVALDPQLTVAYEFGSFFLAQKPPQGAGDPEAAVDLVKRGIAANPDKWRLYYHLGFIHYVERDDPIAAAEAFDAGSRIPGAQVWMKIMAASMKQKGRDYETARQLWRHIYESSNDKMIKDNAVRRLASLQVDQDIDQLEQHVQRYRKYASSIPLSWKQMADAGWLQGIPRDPGGLPYQLTREGRVLVQEPKRFPFITRGLPEGQKSVEMITTETLKPNH